MVCSNVGQGSCRIATCTEFSDSRGESKDEALGMPCGVGVTTHHA